MVSLIPYDCNQLTKYNLPIPLEVFQHFVIPIADIFSYIITKGINSIIISDYNTLDVIRTIHTFNLHNMSVSNCKKFIVGSDSTRIRIWELKSGLCIKNIHMEIFYINPETSIYSKSYGVPSHAFTINNELLVASGSQIKCFTYNQDSNQDYNWNETFTYNIKKQNCQISCIVSNLTFNTFAFGTLQGEVYIFNHDTKQQIYTFTTAIGLLRSDNFPEIISITFNKNILVVSSLTQFNFILNLSNLSLIKIVKPDDEYAFRFTINNLLLTPSLEYVIGTCCNDKSYMWDISNGNIIKLLDINLNEYCIFSPQGTTLVSYGTYNGIDKFSASLL